MIQLYGYVWMPPSEERCRPKNIIGKVERDAGDSHMEE
jgi:hypothetical protein